MKVFDLFVSKYPPGNDLRKPTASGASELLAGIWFRKLWRRFAKNY